MEAIKKKRLAKKEIIAKKKRKRDAESEEGGLVKNAEETSPSRKKKAKQITAPGKLLVPSPTLSIPSLTPSPSTETNASLPCTPLQGTVDLPQIIDPQAPSVEPEAGSPSSTSEIPFVEKSRVSQKQLEVTAECSDNQGYLHPPTPRPNFSRRPSYDLFECIEQSKYKRLSESQARYIFAQVVEAVYYLDCQGITHCDIKDENLVIDHEFKVCLGRPSAQSQQNAYLSYQLGQAY